MAKSTVVIPNYNGMAYIEACLKSLFAGTQQDMEIIVVDNASQDGSLALIKERFPGVQIIENLKNEGFCKAVNQGILASKTPYVILLNNDTQVELSFVHELEKVMEHDKKLFSASAKMISLHERDRIDDAGDYYCALGWAFARGKGKKPENFIKDEPVFAACAGAAIYRKEIFGEIGLFDENHFAYLEDMDIGYRARLHGYHNRFASKAVVYHAGSATSGSRYNAFKTRLSSRNSVYLIYKNMPIGQILLNLPFLIIGFGIKTIFFWRKGFGGEYLKGLWNGIKLSASKQGRAAKTRFKGHRIGNYCLIQLSLWRNLFRLVLL